ncbi:hypothetical protein CSA17_06975 [bacterium DOLJORAL78_65_58]|nr:MAG: hypothetical protein CSB20_09150 [bacterium DOLZORAL124_64_63]PIE75532.1 MAG: hypothetical protein CSA17_06975 [bacterium DOLJORAL78_65_58]
MDPQRDRLKHLLIILLEALSTTGEEERPNRRRIQEKAADAGLDEEDVHGLLDWIESNWSLYRDVPPQDEDPMPDAPSAWAFRYFGEQDSRYITHEGAGYLVRMMDAGQISKVQMEAMLQYAAIIALKPLTSRDLETVIEQVLFRPQRPLMTGGASEGFESPH